eukprot:GSMAST32.ASY1.ANO1.1704.1 assembled CDS
MPGFGVRDVDLFDPHELTVTISADVGTISLFDNDVVGLVYLVGSGKKDRLVRFKGHGNAVNTTLASNIVYQGPSNWSGDDMIHISVSDNGHSGIGGILSDSQSVPITIHPTNDPPTIDVPTNEDGTKTQYIHEEGTFRIIGTFYEPQKTKHASTMQTGYELWWSEILRPVHDTVTIGMYDNVYSMRDGVALDRANNAKQTAIELDDAADDERLQTLPAGESKTTQRIDALKAMQALQEKGVTDLGDLGVDWRQRMVSDINPFNPSSSPSWFVQYDASSSIDVRATNEAGRLYFSADDGIHGRELWRSDGTKDGTELVKDSYPGPESANPKFITPFNNKLYYSGQGVDTTWMIGRGNSPTSNSPLSKTVDSDECNGWRKSDSHSDVWYAVSASTTWDPDRSYDCPLGYHWATTAEADARFRTTSSDEEGMRIGTPYHDTVPYVYWSRCGWKEYSWGTYFRFKDSNKTGSFKHAGQSEVRKVIYDDPTTTQFAGIVCLLGNEQKGVELWETDGTWDGTRRVIDLYPGENSSDPSFLTVMGGHLYFSAKTFAHGSELWRSDGTRENTVLIEDIRLGGVGSNPEYLVMLNTSDGPRLLFAANDGMKGTELWISDGQGTELISDIWPGTESSFPRHLTIMDISGVETLFFTANDPVNGAELRKWTYPSESVISGPRSAIPTPTLVKDINVGATGSDPSFLTVFEGSLYFQADDGIHGRELWRSDGTTNGTILLKDISPGISSSTPSLLTVFDPISTDPLTHPTGTGGSELWLSDGTTIGTKRAFDHTFEDFDVDPKMELINPPSLFGFGGALVYSANAVIKRAEDLDIPSSWPNNDRRMQSFTIKDSDIGDKLMLVDLWCGKGEISLGQTKDITFLSGGQGESSMQFEAKLQDINNALQAVSYTGKLDQSGEDMLHIAVNDTYVVQSDYIDIWIEAVNDAPQISLPTGIHGERGPGPGSYSTKAEVELSIRGIVVDDVDVNDRAERSPRVLIATVTTTSSGVDGVGNGGRITLSSVEGLKFEVGDGVFDQSMEFIGSLDDINYALYNLKYICWNGDGCVSGGIDVIKVQVSDRGNHGTGGEKTVVALINVTITK